MKRIKANKYLDQLGKRRRLIARIWPFILLVGSGLLSVYLYRIVKNNYLDFPVTAQRYLLDTIFTSFSNKHLHNLPSETSSSILFIPALVIYWSHQILTGIVIFCGYYVVFHRPLSSLKTVSNIKAIEEGLGDIHNLIKVMNNYIDDQKFFHRLHLRFLINTIGVYYLISPINHNWYQKSQHQWFTISDLSKDTKKILFTLSNLKTALRNDFKNQNDITFYVNLYTILELFLLTTINQTQSIKISDLESNSDGLIILQRFATDASPVIINSLKSPKGKSRSKPKIITAFLRIFQSPIVRVALGFSGITAFIMLIGVFLFKVDGLTAFNTWFTVTFGSFSVSLSLATIKQLSNSTKTSNQDTSSDRFETEE